MCVVLSARLNVVDLQQALLAAVQAGMNDCVQTIMRRPVKPGQALHVAITNEDSTAFKVMIAKCCPLTDCLGIRDNSALTVLDRVTARKATSSDSQDPFWLAVSDAQARKCVAT